MRLIGRSLKLKTLFVFFFTIFLIIIVKLFYLQVISPNQSYNDYLKTRKILAERGKIFDRNGQPLAVNKTTYLLYFEPQKITEEDRLIRNLSEILKLEEASLEAQLDKTKVWQSIKGGISKENKEKIAQLNLKGVGFDEEYQRYYPESSLSAHLLGFLGKDSKGESIGYFGIEGFYNKDLAGSPGFIKTERDIVDRPIFLGTQNKIEPLNGRDFILTIDRSVQKIIKDKLRSGLEQYQAKEGCVIVADPSNMEILGLSCLPDFDQEKYYEFSEDFFKNSTISDSYEPGSIFKPLIMAAAIEEKAVKPEDTYNEEGPVNIGDYTIRTWNNQYQGRITMTRILEKSSNVGMVYVGEKMGGNKLLSYMEKYGFGEKTGIDLQGEINGLIKPKNLWYPIDYATATFGQGIGVTSIQIIRAFASIINGGKLFIPKTVYSLKYEDQEQRVNPILVRNIISEKTSAVIRKMLVSTVENGDAKWAKPKGYVIGGKTGTAQIPIAGKYDPSKTVASFIGFAPADKPKFIVLVTLKEPKSSPWGSETAAPLFFDISRDLILYYNIAPGQ